MLKLKLQYFCHLTQSADSLEKTLVLGKIEGRRIRRWQRMRWLDSITNSMDMTLHKLRDIVQDREAWRAAVHGITKHQTRLGGWKTTTIVNLISFFNYYKRLENSGRASAYRCICNTQVLRICMLLCSRRLLRAEAGSQTTFGHCSEYLIPFGQRGTIGEGEVNSESSTDTYTLPCVK